MGEADGNITGLRTGRVQHGRLDSGQTPHPGHSERCVLVGSQLSSSGFL